MQQQAQTREVNQQLSKYINLVQQGHEIIITKRGKPVARLSNIQKKRELSPQQQSAYARTKQRMKKGFNLGINGIDREQIHER